MQTFLFYTKLVARTRVYGVYTNENSKRDAPSISLSTYPQVCYFLGIVIGTIAAVVTEFAGGNTTVVYAVAVLIGAASSITMVTALSVTAELIGSRTERSALVYSVVTFLDKIVTGLVVISIERW